MPKAQINGYTMHYHVHGTGIPIVFIHPPLINSAVFRYQEVQLTDLFQVITFDIRGHGFSSPSDLPVTYPLIVEDSIRLLDHLGIEQAYFCGYSTGGGVVLEAMLNYPHRARGGICLGAMPEAGDWNVKAQIAAASWMAKLGMKTSLALLIAKANADMSETFHNLYYEAMRGDIENWRQYFEASLKYRATKRLLGLKEPVLLVYGEKDRRFNGYGHQLHQLLPHSTLAHIPGAKHYIPTQFAGEFHHLLYQWVKQHEEGNEAVGDDAMDRGLGIHVPDEAKTETPIVFR